MGQYKKLWYALIAVLIVTFSILGYLGTEVYRQAPPSPISTLPHRAKPLSPRKTSLPASLPGRAPAVWKSVR